MTRKNNLVKQKDGFYSLKNKTQKFIKDGCCHECGEVASSPDLLYEYNKDDFLLVKSYVEEHLISYSNHKSMSAEWCDTCKTFKGYKIRLK